MSSVIPSGLRRPLLARGPLIDRPIAYLFAPIGLLVVFFVVPMLIILLIALQRNAPGPADGYTLQHFANVLTNSLYYRVALNTVVIVTSAQAVMLVIGVPLAYFMAFKVGRWELIILLLLVLADELNPVVKIYAWRMLLGRDGLVNGFLEAIGVIQQPMGILLFSRLATVITLSASWITYTTIPIYAAMKAIDPSLFEAASDLGAGWWTRTRRILLPLAAPGLFIAMILVYIPMFTDFVTPSLVGGTTSYMLGNAVNDLVLAEGNWGDGAALNFVLLVFAVIVSLVAYRLARINRVAA